MCSYVLIGNVRELDLDSVMIHVNWEFEIRSL